MAAKKKVDTEDSKLPKAPMIEVVFEVRWKLQDGPPGIPLMQSDPGLVPLLDRFSKQMDKIGFGVRRDMSHAQQTGAYGVARRFSKSTASPFPMQQVGPGIFATNDDAEYSWSSFKGQALQGLKALFAAYPKMDFFPFLIQHLELRFIDIFRPSLVPTKEGFVGFAKGGTNLSLDLPASLSDPKLFESTSRGRFVLEKTLKARKQTLLVVDLASAIQQDVGDDVIRMETKVLTKGDGIPKQPPGPKLLSELERWLEQAHDVLSPAFKQLVKKEILEKYKLAA